MALQVSKEQAVLGGTIVILGLMLWQSGPSDGGGGTRSSRKLLHTRDRVGNSCFAPVVQLIVCERSFKGQLKIDIAKNGFVNIEDYGRWQLSRILLFRHRTPGRIVNIALQVALCRSVYLDRDGSVFSGVLYP